MLRPASDHSDFCLAIGHKMVPAMYLETLGRLRLRGAALTRPKPLLLLSYLCLEGSQSRHTLAQLFFPTSRDPADALSTTVRRIRQIANVIEEEPGRLTTTLQCDATALLTHLAARELTQATALYGGCFGADFGAPLEVELEEWLFCTRERIDKLMRDAHLELAEQAQRSHDLQRAQHHAERALRFEAPRSSRDLRRLHGLLAGTAAAATLHQDAADIGIFLGEPSDLPAPITQFVGRQVLLDDLMHCFEQGKERLVTLHGPGGIGKTRLALEVAHRLHRAGRFANGVFFLALESIENLADLPGRLAIPLGLGIAGATNPYDALAQGVGTSEALLVLDNFEHLVSAGPSLVQLLVRCPKLALLITSRTKLKLQAERVVSLEGLQLPANGVGTMEFNATEWRNSEAFRLLGAWSELSGTRQVWTLEDMVEAAVICTRLGGYPLALELAAARLAVEPVSALRVALEEDVIGLASPFHDSHPRHQGVRVVFEHSWQKRTAAEQCLLAQLSIFRGGFTLEAAERITGATQAALLTLVDAALVQMPSPGRFDFHALLQQYLRSKLSEDQALERRVIECHASYFAERLAVLNLAASGTASPGLMEFTLGEHSNLLAALRWLVTAGRYDALTGMAEPLLWHMGIGGHLEVGVRLFEEILKDLPPEAPAARDARVAFAVSHGWSHMFLGDFVAGVRCCETAAQLATASGDVVQTMRAFDALAQAYYRSGRFAEAVPFADRALHLARVHGEPVRLARVLGTHGMTLAYVGEYAISEASFAEAFTLYDAGKVPIGIDSVWLCTYLGASRLLSGRFEGSITALERGYQMISTAPPPFKVLENIMRVLESLALLERGLDMSDVEALERAESYCRVVLDRVKQSGERIGKALVQIVMGRIELARGEVTRARETTLTGLRLASSDGSNMVVMWGLPYLAEIAAASGNAVLAARLAIHAERSLGCGAIGQAAARRTRVALADSPVFADIVTSSVPGFDTLMTAVLDWDGLVRNR
jgi:predicted ATPase